MLKTKIFIGTREHKNEASLAFFLINRGLYSLFYGQFLKIKTETSRKYIYETLSIIRQVASTKIVQRNAALF